MTGTVNCLAVKYVDVYNLLWNASIAHLFRVLKDFTPQDNTPQ